jgi:Mn2+/Fe2+ NRAMP family transporter
MPVANDARAIPTYIQVGAPFGTSLPRPLVLSMTVTYLVQEMAACPEIAIGEGLVGQRLPRRPDSVAPPA